MILSFFGLRFNRRRSVWIFPVSLVALTMLFVGPLGTKFGIFDFQLGLLILAFSFIFSKDVSISNPDAFLFSIISFTLLVKRVSIDDDISFFVGFFFG